MGSKTFSCNSLMQSIEKMIVFLIHFLPSFEKIKLPLRYFGYFFNCFSFWEVGCAKIFVKSFCLYMTQRYSSNFFQLPTEGVSHHTHHLDSKLFFCLFCHFIHVFFFHLFSKSLIDYYMLLSMKIILEKALKTLIRLSDPGPIEKSSLCPGWSTGTKRMRIVLEKDPKTLIRLSDPGPIEKSPLWFGIL